MIKIGITGSTGSLGKVILKKKLIYLVLREILEKKSLENWIKKNKIKLFFI